METKKTEELIGLPSPRTYSLKNGGEIVLRAEEVRKNLPILIYPETLGIFEDFGSKMMVFKQLLAHWGPIANFVHVALPGFLDARPPTNVTEDTYIEALAGVFDIFYSGEPLIFMGHSTPTTMLTRFAHKHPEKVGLLVLSCPPGNYDRGVYGKIMPTIQKIVGKDFVKLPGDIQQKLLRSLTCQTVAITHSLSIEQKVTLAKTIGDLIVNSENSHLLAAVPVRTIIFKGGRDVLAPPWSTETEGINNNPKVRIITFPNEGHVGVAQKLAGSETSRVILDEWQKL